MRARTRCALRAVRLSWIKDGRTASPATAPASIPRNDAQSSSAHNCGDAVCYSPARCVRELCRHLCQLERPRLAPRMAAPPQTGFCSTRRRKRIMGAHGECAARQWCCCTMGCMCAHTARGNTTPMQRCEERDGCAGRQIQVRRPTRVRYHREQERHGPTMRAARYMTTH